MESELLIGSLCKDVLAIAQPGTLCIRYTGTDLNVKLGMPSSWHTLCQSEKDALLFNQSVNQLLEEGLLSIEGTELRVSHEVFVGNIQSHFSSLAPLFRIAPFSISVSAHGILGRNDFRFEFGFLLGRKAIFGKRVGPFLSIGRSIYCLRDADYTLVSRIEAFNCLPETRKTKSTALETLGILKDLPSNVNFDDYLRSEQIIIPSRVKVDIRMDSDGRISLVPRFEGVPDAGMEKTFLSLSNVQSIYDLELGGGRLRVIVRDEIAQILRDLQKIRHEGDPAVKDRVFADIHSVFTEGTNLDLIDLALYGPRIKGIGGAPEFTKVCLRKDPSDWGGLGESPEKLFPIELLIGDDNKILRIESKAELLELKSLVDKSKANGECAITYRGLRIYLDDRFLKALEELLKLVPLEAPRQKHSEKERRGASSVSSLRYLLIYTNEESEEYKEGSVEEISSEWTNSAIIPKSLKESFVGDAGVANRLQLKPHQLSGLGWLQRMFKHRHITRGVMLADDMGLGKTLQILSFLAWCIEEGLKESLGSETGPYEPILIVSPPILVDIWLSEMTKYFNAGVFEPTLRLRDQELKRLTVNRDKGREIELGVSKLDLGLLREYRVIVTNYDTVRNYQHSFARIPWSVIVTDEAQEFKEQNARSHALKSLVSAFKIISTGTPVENRLMDLWNLVDYMQPGSLLGSSRDFHETFEKDIDHRSHSERTDLSKKLRRLLRYGSKDAFLLRRRKEDELKSLPRKVEHTLISPLSHSQRAEHVNLVKTLGAHKGQGQHFTLIHALRHLYLHPRLLMGDQPIEDPLSLIEESPKLKSVIDELSRIKKLNEKVLVFALTRELQRLLAEVFKAVFQLEIDIINGSVEQSMPSRRDFRQELISRFSQAPGFQILILSPKVAGVGLTITAANHVIHYERWWNPAKEAQATDRAYRIGQERDVHVYYPISKDPQAEFVTFDEKLSELLDSKRKLASDFLVPIGSLEVTNDEITNGVVEGAPSESSSAKDGTRIVTAIDSAERVRNLDGHRFESFVGALYRKEGHIVVLGPKSRDGGADLVVVSPKEVILVQCKHTRNLRPIAFDVVRDLIDAGERYRAEALNSNLRKRPLRLVGLTNSTFDSDTVSIAQSEGITLSTETDLLRRMKHVTVTAGDLRLLEEARPRSWRDLIDQLGSL